MGKHAHVLFAQPEQQWLILVPWVQGDTVNSLIHQSDILNQATGIDLTVMAVGIYGKICSLETRVQEGDRIEIYRPLFQHPMDARRNRINK